MVFHVTGKTGYAVVAGLCVIVLAFVPLYVTTGHLALSGWHEAVASLVSPAFITIVAQNLKQARDDDEREGRDQKVLAYLKEIAEFLEKKDDKT